MFSRTDVTLDQVLFLLSSAYRKVKLSTISPIIKKDLKKNHSDFPNEIDWSVFGNDQQWKNIVTQSKQIHDNGETSELFNTLEFMERLLQYYQLNKKLFSKQDLMDYRHKKFIKNVSKSAEQNELTKETENIWAYYEKFMTLEPEKLTSLIEKRLSELNIAQIKEEFITLKTAYIIQQTQDAFSALTSDDILARQDGMSHPKIMQDFKKKSTEEKPAATKISQEKTKYEQFTDCLDTAKDANQYNALTPTLTNSAHYKKLKPEAQFKLALDSKIIDTKNNEFAKAALRTSGWTFFTRPKSRNLDAGQLIELLKNFADDTAVIDEIFKKRGLFRGENFWKKIVNNPIAILKLTKLSENNTAISDQIAKNTKIRKKVNACKEAIVRTNLPAKDERRSSGPPPPATSNALVKTDVEPSEGLSDTEQETVKLNTDNKKDVVTPSSTISGKQSNVRHTIAAP